MGGNSKEKLGVFDFLEMIYDGHSEFSLIAVRAPLDETLEAYIDFANDQESKERFDPESNRMIRVEVQSMVISRHDDVKCVQATEDDDIDWAIPFIEVVGSEWTIILRSVFDLDDEMYDVVPEAVGLSGELNTETVVFMEQNESDSISYSLFKDGKFMEKLEVADEMYFESKLRTKDDVKFYREFEKELENDYYYDDEDEDDYNVHEEVEMKMFSEIFKDLGIYLPACYATIRDGSLVLGVESPSEGAVVRAHLIEVEEEFEDF